MYDFIYSEVWWMETIIAALITAFATLGIAYLAYGSKINEILRKFDDLRAEHGTLSKAHDVLSKEHEKLLEKNHEILKEQVLISSFTSETKSTVNAIHKDALLEKGRQEALLSSLSSSGKELNEFINTGVNSIKALQQEYMKLSETSNNQFQEISELKKNINQLRENIEELREENNALDKENDKLIEDYNTLAKNYDNLVQSKNPRIEPTREFDNGFDR